MDKKLSETIIEGLKNKKAKEIVNIDLSEIENSFCDNFIICHGTSNTQVNALATSVEKEVKEKEGESGYKEGVENAAWVIISYHTTVVHIFQEETRKYYNLEELWADAKIEHIED